MHTALQKARNEPLVAKYPARIDRNRQAPSVCREHLGTNLWEIWDFLKFRLKNFMFHCRVEPQLLESVLQGTLTAGRTAAARTFQNTTMIWTRETCAVRERPPFFGSIRAMDFGTPRVGPISFTERK